MNGLGRRLVTWICSTSARHPLAWLAGAAIVSVPALFGLRSLELDTDLIRLLPKTSRAAIATTELGPVVGGGSYAVVLFEGDDREQVLRAVEATAARVATMEDVASVEYELPIDFIEQYRFLLIPVYYLDQINNRLSGRPARPPQLGDAGGAVITLDENGETFAQRQDRRDLDAQIREYSNLPRYHQSPDGRIMGMLVRTARGVTSLGASRRLFRELETIAQEASREYGLWSGVTGSLRNKIDEFDVIVSDLGRSGVIAVTAIILTLLISFRSFRIIPVVLLPLGAGLLWAGALVPPLVGGLNLITSFLLIVMFGMGIDYAIHFVKRYQHERADRDTLAALEVTFTSTGPAVAISGLTTALALLIVAASDFKGFSEFGLIGGLAIVVIIVAMFTVMPATLVMGTRLGMVHAARPVSSPRLVPTRLLTLLLGAAVGAALVAAVTALAFDYDFNNMRFTVNRAEEVNERSRKVFTSSRSPAAVFVAPNIETLDQSLAMLTERRDEPGSTLGRIASIRDVVPTPEDTERRLELLDQIQRKLRGFRLLLMGSATRRFAAQLRAWEPPPIGPPPEDVPPVVKLGLIARDGSDRFLISVYPSVERRNGKNAMAFTQELYAVPLPVSLEGPVGETPVLAEILWLVTGEGPWLAGLSLLGVFLAILAYRRSVAEAGWMILPLVSGMILTLGVMAVAGLKLNFFNVVIIPALLGLGVDHGVHYYRRWKELESNTAATQAELLGPLTVCSATTMMGYFGMLFSSHKGLQSMGLLACLGLTCISITSLVLLPGLLDWVRGGSRGRASQDR